MTTTSGIVTIYSMSNRSKTFLLFIIDILIIIFSLSIALLISKLENFNLSYLFEHIFLFAWVYPFWVLMFFIEGLYSLTTFKLQTSSLAASLLRSTVITIIISAAITYFLPTNLYTFTPKTNLFLTAIISFPLLYLWRIFFYKLFSKSSRLKNTVVIGSNASVNFVKNQLELKPYLGFKIIGNSLPLPENTEIVAIERHSLKDETYQEVFNKLGTGLEVIDLALFAEMISRKIPLESIDESWFIEYCGYQKSRSFEILKGLLDKSVAILLLILLTPFALISFPILLIFHGRPIFFKQSRTGLYNKPFTLYKLRTMVNNAEKDGAQWARPKDTRVTPLGKILRKTRLDELPQLINILKGDMSLVGPRPERPEIIENQLAPKIPFYNLRHLVKPGVTGWAQIVFRYGFSEEDSKEKLQYDLFYVKNKSIWLDIVIIIKTIKTVITGAGQ